MIGVRFEIIFILTVGLAKACNITKTLPHLERRARNYGRSESEPLINDLFLNGGWYKVTGETGQYKMPDSKVSVPLNGCGTINQISIKDIHPDVTTETSVNVTACVHGGQSQCYTEFNISIRNCSGELQYRLPTTGRNQAYCFDPLKVQGIKNISAAPTNFHPGVVTILPNLKWTRNITNGYNTPELYFECSFKQTTGLFYEVTWYVDGLKEIRKGPNKTSAALRLTTTELVDEGFYLGIELQCDVRASVDESGFLTPPSFANKFFAGIKILNHSVILNNYVTNVSIWFYSTVPIGCRYPASINSNNPCAGLTLPVQMKNPYKTCAGGTMTFERCHKGIKLLSENEPFEKTLYDFHVVNSKFKYIEPTHQQLLLQTGDGAWLLPFFMNQDLPVVSVIIDGENSSWKLRRCYSHGDPHMKTFDNEPYGNQQVGDFVLYRNTRYGIEVQERTSPCLSATCTCQVAVRAGGDVFVVNRCPGTTWFNEFRSCNDGGILDVVRENENLYWIYTPIGTVVEIKIYYMSGTFIDVDIFSSPKDLNYTEGLCGFYDGDSSNDFGMSNGSRSAYNKHMFANKWRVVKEKGLLTNYDLYHLQNWNSMNSFLCVCNKSWPFLKDEVAVDVDEALCGALPSAECTNTSFTRNKCNKTIHVAKRSFSRREFNKEWFVKTTKLKTANERQERSAESDPLTEEEVRSKCSNIIRNAPSVIQFPERLMGENIDGVVEQCVFDVMASDGDISIGEIHARSLDNAVKQTFSYEPTFVAKNKEIIQAFLQNTCSNNCSARGVCSVAGQCICDSLYHGPECELYERNPIHVDLIQGDGVCDTALGDDCQCHWFYTKNLLENFTCKFQQFKVGVDNNKNYMGEFVAPGEYDDMFTGQCCLPETRNERSVQSTGLGYEWKLTVSNDGTHFGTGQTLYIIDQTCLDVVTNTSTNERILKIKDSYCLIDFQCVTNTEMRFSDQCQICNVHLNPFGWTYVCQETKEAQKTTPKIVSIAVGTTVGGVAVICAVIWLSCKLRNCQSYRVTKKTKLYEPHSNEAFHTFPEVPCKST